ncbi:MAG TPA: MDR family MFS transporter [Pseudonocardia sp.]|jgi:EmrB/QacA subfamily drug resistance transporter|nr:MDR family MFS transporter [Pseudonocardia sp.]
MAPLLVLMLGSFLPPMDSAIVNVPIPHIQKDLGGGADDVAWISTAYSLGLAVFVPLSNWLTDRFGLTRVHRAALIGFLVGSGLCGMAWDLNSLIAFRVLTAIPGSIVPVVTISMIYRIVPRESIGTAMGLYGLGVIVAPSLGPTLGGLIVQDLSWRWIFLFKEPIGLLTVIVGLFLIPKMEGSAKVGKFDWWGYLTFGYGLSAIIVVSAKGQKWHWGSYPVLILAVSAVLSLALFAVIENEVENPLIDLRIFRCWPFVNSLLLIGVLLIMLFGVVYYVPQFMQNVQGFDARHAGLALLPMGLLMVVAVPLAGKLYDRVGPRWPALVGMIGSVGGLWLMTGLTVGTGRGEISLWIMLAMLGGALGMMPIMTNGLSWLPPHLVGYGGAMNNVMQRAASALGVAVVGVIVSRSSAQLTADTNALQTAAALPQYRDADQGTLFGLYQATQGIIQAKADADAFLVTAGLAVVAALLVLMLKKPPRRPEPAAAPAVRPTVKPTAGPGGSAAVAARRASAARRAASTRAGAPQTL